MTRTISEPITESEANDLANRITAERASVDPLEDLHTVASRLPALAMELPTADSNNIIRRDTGRSLAMVDISKLDPRILVLTANSCLRLIRVCQRLRTDRDEQDLLIDRLMVDDRSARSEAIARVNALRSSNLGQRIARMGVLGQRNHPAHVAQEAAVTAERDDLRKRLRDHERKLRDLADLIDTTDKATWGPRAVAAQLRDIAEES